LAGQPVLIMIQGSEPGSIFKLPDNRVSTIGRSSRNSIRLVNPAVSRFHCEIACVNGRWDLTDLNSRKGTLVNGTRVEGHRVLNAGDIIRLSGTTFRFDMLDESALRDGAIVAIMEAELDQKLLTKGEATGSLADIRARSRMEGAQQAESRQHSRRALRVNGAFVVASGVLAVAVLVGAALYAHVRPRPARQAQTALAAAAAALQSGDVAVALEKLRAVEAGHPGTELARRAAQMRAEAVWTAVQEGFSKASLLEAQGDYAGSLQAYKGLEGLGPDPLLKGLLARRRGCAERLARASYRAVEQAAQGRAGRGELKAALALYRGARERVGLPELREKADARILELEKRISGS